MSRDCRKLFRLCILQIILPVLVLGFLVHAARAGWLPDGVPVCTDNAYQGSLVSVPDRQGGVLLVWQDHRETKLRIYAHRLDANGNLLWDEDGTALYENGDQLFHPWICPTGTGGAWVVWNERTGGYGSIRVQRLDASGTPDFAPSAGLSIATGGPWSDNSLPVCASDGLGGVIVAWVQEPSPPSGDYQVVAQRIDANGTVSWTAGGVLAGDDIGAGEELCIATNEEQSFGAFLGWRTSTGAGVAQWVDLSGTPRWNGIYGHGVGITTAGSRVRVADRRRVNQGAYVMYKWRGGLQNLEHLHVISMDSTTYEFWDENVDSESIVGDYTVGDDYRVMDDELNGVYCVWDRIDGDGGGLGVYIKRFDSSGDAYWGPRLVSAVEAGNHSPDATFQYGYGGVFVTWVGEDGGDSRLKYAMVERQYGWPSTEVLVPHGYSSTRPWIVAEYDQGATPLISWMDELIPTDINIYATGLEPGGDPLHPNLVATEMYPEVDPGDIGGGTHSFYVKVKNLGTSQAGSYWTTIFPDQLTPPMVGDTPPPGVQSVECPPLDAGDSVLVEILIDPPATPQTWSMWGFADYQGDVEEFGEESDNIFGPMSYEWISLPNLTITQFTLSKSNPRLGEYVQATIRVENLGTADADPFDVDFYEDLGAPPGPGVTGDQTYHAAGLIAGGAFVWNTALFTHTGNLAAWDCYAQVDTQHEVAESDENDNIAGPRELGWCVPLHEGWPAAGGAGFRSSPAIAGLDDDPATREVVVGCDDGKLYAWDYEGNSLLGWPVFVGDTLWSSPAVGDITGDYHLEVVIGCDDGHLYAYDYKGRFLWSHAAGYPVNTTPALADLDEDGKLEVVYAVGAGTGGGQVHVLEGDGSNYPLLSTMNLAGPGATSPAVCDVDDDGDYEIAVVSYGLTKPIAHSLVYLFNDLGLSYNANWPVQIDTVVVAPPVLGDITGAGTGPLEVVACGLDGGVYVFDLNGSLWPSSPQVNGRIETSPALVQYDGDQYHEMLISSRRWVETFPPFGYYIGAVTAFDDDGSILTGWPHSTASWLAGLALPSPVALETRIILGSPPGDIHGWRNETGQNTIEFPFDAGGSVQCPPAIGDLDGDGFHDLVVATTADSVYCYNFSVSSHFGTNYALEWPLFRNGRTRTGCSCIDPATGVEDEPEPTPAVTALRSVYPNPFNPATRITFDLKQHKRVTLAVYDLAGRRVAILEDRVMRAGRHEAVWNGRTDEGRNAASGLYFCRLIAGRIVDTKKLVLLR